MFSQTELDYIRSQSLARIGTASPTAKPDVAVVGFDFDGEFFYVSGRRNQRTRKYLNTKKNPFTSFLIDDLASVRPWRPRGLKIDGEVDFVIRNGYAGEKEYLRVTPRPNTPGDSIKRIWFHLIGGHRRPPKRSTPLRCTPRIMAGFAGQFLITVH